MIKKWHLKAVIQKFIAALPYNHKINFLFQKYVTKGVVLNYDHFEVKFGHGADHVNNWVRLTKARSLEDISCLEIGSGWYPIVPICYFLHGAEKTYSYDISALMTAESIITKIGKFIEYEDLVRSSLPSIKEERWEQLLELNKSIDVEIENVESLSAKINLILCVKDARNSGLANQSIDLISSNNTFEHVDPNILKGILKEFWRVLSPNGLMSHFIDMSDHFAHMDHSINIYNFLQYSESKWKMIDNQIQPQNRWRLKQYTNLYDQLQIPYEEWKIRPGREEEVKSHTLASPFKEMSIKEVAISHGYLLSIKAAE